MSSSSFDAADVDLEQYLGSLQQRLPALQPGESMSSYTRRIQELLDVSKCLVVCDSDMEQDGLYLYKRPVRGDSTNVLAATGTVMHHIILYVRSAEKGLVSLEMAPQGDADIARNIFETVEAGPIVCHAASPPEKHFPVLHLDVPHHSLSDKAVQEAIKFTQAQPYHTLQGNCIQFCDFMVRLLTGGAMCAAPLAYDALCGRVPPVDSPLLSMMALTMQLSWLDVVDGSRLMERFLKDHQPPPPLALPKHLMPPASPAPTVSAAAANGASAISKQAASTVAAAPGTDGGVSQLLSLLSAARGSQAAARPAGTVAAQADAAPDLLSALLAGAGRPAAAGATAGLSASGAPDLLSLLAARTQFADHKRPAPAANGNSAVPGSGVAAAEGSAMGRSSASGAEWSGQDTPPPKRAEPAALSRSRASGNVPADGNAAEVPAGGTGGMPVLPSRKR